MTPSQIRRLMRDAESLIAVYAREDGPSSEERRNIANEQLHSALTEELDRLNRLEQLLLAGIAHLEEEEKKGG